MRERGIQNGDGTRTAWALAACAVDALLLAVQIGLLLRGTGVQFGDARSYLDLAIYCAQNATWYPNARNMYDTYVFGNGYVNILAACMRLAPGLPWVELLNLAFMQAIVWLSAGIAWRMTHRLRPACLTAMLICLSAGFWGEVVAARTELCFIALSCLSLYLLTFPRTATLFLAGVAVALANWVRPLLVVYLPGMLLFLWLRRAGIRRMSMLLAGALAMTLVIGAGAQRLTGRFIFQAQTMGINMLMGANDDADGSYNDAVFREGKAGYIDPQRRARMTFYEIDALYKDEAIAWMARNPMSFFLLAPAKLFYFLATDTYGGCAFLGRETDNLAYLLELWNVLLGRGERSLLPGDVVVLYEQAFYMCLLTAYALSVVNSLRRRCLRDTLHLHAIVLGACGVAVLTVGGARYHMPYIPIFCICAAIAWDGHATRRAPAAA